MMNLTLQPVNNLSYKGERPLTNLHMLKAIGAVMVVAIHAPGMFPAWIEGITRYGVIAFLMITGYFLPSADGTVSCDRIRRDIVKIFRIDVAAQSAYILFRLIQCTYTPGLFRDSFMSLHGWTDFLLTGRWFGFQLWYLHAVILALCVIYFLTWIKKERLLYFLVPAGILINLAVGSYFYLWNDAELSPFASRNFLTVCVPGIAIGIWLRRHEHELPAVKTLVMTTVVLMALSIAEAVAIIDVKSIGDVMCFSFPATMALFALMLKAPQISESNFMADFGRNHSMNVYLTHVMVIMLLSDICAIWDAWSRLWFWLCPVTIVLSYLISGCLRRGSAARVRTSAGAWYSNRR